MQTYNFSPIGFISSCYKEKFGIPRQSGLVKAAPASLVLNEVFNQESVRGLDGFSHLWISFVFHANEGSRWKQMVRPPRLGGNEKVGVFASRSPFRPNPMGLSVVEIDYIELPNTQHNTQPSNNKNITIKLLGCDLLDGTPVLDIKPYIPYTDSIEEANGGFAKHRPKNQQFIIEFTPQAKHECEEASKHLNQDIPKIITEILGLDPRPSYKSNKLDNKVYSMKLFDFDLKWQYCENDRIRVLNLIS